MMTRVSKRWLGLGALAVAVPLAVAACTGGDNGATQAAGAAAPPGGGGPGSVAEGVRAPATSAFPVSASQQTGIWVDGSGSVKVAPDVAVLNLGVETRADTAAAARTSAAEAMEAVLASLRKNGVQDRDIQTTGFQVQPITVFKQPTGGIRDGEPMIVGYRVTNSATARVRELARVGTAIDDATEAAGNAIRINGIGFTVDNPKPLEEQARELALRDATAKAQQVARVAGVKLGRPTLITLQGGAPIVDRQLLAVAEARAAGTPISPGETQVTIAVQMAFAIE